MKSDGTTPPRHDIYGLIDINCHILPGMADGPQDMKESIEMLKLAYAEGIRTIVATPLYNGDKTDIRSDKLDKFVKELNKKACEIDENLKIYLGCEVAYSDASHEKIVMGKLESMADSKYVMLRFDYHTDFDTIAEAIRDINMDSYIPIVADIEFYNCLDGDIEKVEELIQLGAYVQIKASSVTGEMGHDIRSFVKKLLKNQLVHFVATGAANTDDKAPLIKECAEYIERKYGYEYMNELLFINPKAVIENDDIDL